MTKTFRVNENLQLYNNAHKVENGIFRCIYLIIRFPLVRDIIFRTKRFHMNFNVKRRKEITTYSINRENLLFYYLMEDAYDYPLIITI